jgi:hypothetical protein
MRTLRGIKTHPYAPSYGAQIADDEQKEGVASPLRPADDETLDWARSFWPEAPAEAFEWDRGGRKVLHLESGETLKIRFGHPRGGELESDIACFVSEDYSPRLLLRPEGSVRRAAERGDGLVTRDDHVIAAFRGCGAMLRRGVGVRVPSLPHSKRSLTVLRLEANRDADVRLAYQVAWASRQTVTRQLRPQTLRRACGTILTSDETAGPSAVPGSAAAQKGEVKNAGREHMGRTAYRNPSTNRSIRTSAGGRLESPRGGE